eukprot:2686480-Amphidinium_carterae.2
MLLTLLSGQRIRWMTAPQTQAVDRGTFTAADLHGTGQVDELAITKELLLMARWIRMLPGRTLRTRFTTFGPRSGG